MLQYLSSPSSVRRSPETIVCACRKTTYGQLLEMFESVPQASFGQLKDLYKFGDRCTSCEIEVRDMLDDFQKGRLQRRNGRLPLRVWVRLFRQRRQAFREAKERQKTALRRAGLFVISDDRIESVLVLSNVGFPEDKRNANGRRVAFKALLYDAGGQRVAESDQSLRNGASRDYSLEQLFPNVQIPKPFVGCLYLDFYRLWELGSLRPYCLFRDKKGCSLWHYHDKYRGVSKRRLLPRVAGLSGRQAVLAHGLQFDGKAVQFAGLPLRQRSDPEHRGGDRRDGNALGSVGRAFPNALSSCAGPIVSFLAREPRPDHGLVCMGKAGRRHLDRAAPLSK